jgi:hypothetical protein
MNNRKQISVLLAFVFLQRFIHRPALVKLAIKYRRGAAGAFSGERAERSFQPDGSAVVFLKPGWAVIEGVGTLRERHQLDSGWLTQRGGAHIVLGGWYRRRKGRSMLSPGRAERSFQSDESAAGFPETGVGDN